MAGRAQIEIQEIEGKAPLEKVFQFFLLMKEIRLYQAYKLSIESDEWQDAKKN